MQSLGNPVLSDKVGYPVTFSSCSFYDGSFPQKAFLKALNSHLVMPRQEGKEFYFTCRYPLPVYSVFEFLAK